MPEFFEIIFGEEIIQFGKRLRFLFLLFQISKASQTNGNRNRSQEDTLQLTVDAATPKAIADWTADNDDLVNVLDGKIAKLPRFTTENQRLNFRNQVLKWFMEGQEMLANLRTYPSTYERVVQAKSHRENYLASLSLNVATPAEQFRLALQQLLDTYREQVKEMSRLSAESLAHEALADWLIRCPLDFTEVVADV